MRRAGGHLLRAGRTPMLVLDVLTPDDAVRAINVDVILLLVGMMVLVSALTASSTLAGNATILGSTLQRDRRTGRFP